MIPTDLFSYAYIPAWYEQLYELSQLAAPEPWRFRQPTYETQNNETPILERYINQIFKKQTVEYNCVPPEEADNVFYLRNEFSCFHTGLYTRSYKAIYMCFDRNKRLNTLRQWYFKGFATDDSPWFKYVQLLPQRPAFLLRQEMTYYDPEWEIRVNAGHILGDEENVARLPESIRTAWNLPMHRRPSEASAGVSAACEANGTPGAKRTVRRQETAVELARRKALSDWNLAVPQMFQGRVQYLLPIHLTNMERPDLAMALSIMDGYYIGHTCLTLEMAYQNARLLARPTAGWLTQLVE